MTAQPMLLVSGPSGGGKSTFIRQLAAGTLAPGILERLPAGTGNWPLVEANDILKGDLAKETLPAGSPGLLVHYDIVFIHRYGVPSYEDDPALGLLENAAPLHIVFVRPDCGVVRQQFLDRQTRHRKTKSTASLLWSRFFRLPMRRLLAPLTGKPTQSTEDIYTDDKWLAACYLQWETFLHRLAERHPDARLTIVEPTGEGETFRLLEARQP